MSKPYRDFEPKWYHGEVPPTSYRSIFKWGAPDQIKPPKESLYKLVKEKFGLTDADFGHYTENLGLDAVRFDLPCTMEQRRLDAFRDIVGAEYVRTDDYARLSVAYGKTMYDILRLRNQVVENVPDAVLYPDNKGTDRANCGLLRAGKDTGLCLWRRLVRHTGRGVHERRYFAGYAPALQQSGRLQ